jgi:hypothetical protein
MLTFGKVLNSNYYYIVDPPHYIRDNNPTWSIHPRPYPFPLPRCPRSCFATALKIAPKANAQENPQSGHGLRTLNDTRDYSIQLNLLGNSTSYYIIDVPVNLNVQLEV